MSEQVALCGSHKCTGILDSRITLANYAVIDVKSGSQCPKCGSALIWRKKRTRMRVKDRVRQKRDPFYMEKQTAI